MGEIRKSLTGILASLFLAGCDLIPLPNGEVTPTPSPTPHRSWADIEFIVEGNEYINQASNITYGRIDSSNGNWVDGFYTFTGSVPLNWTSGTHNDCTGHYIRVGVSAWDTDNEARVTLKIKDDGVVKATKELEGPLFLDNLEYYIPSQ